VFIFHRTELAHEYALRLLDPPPTSSVRSGLFLAAPRRTGKTTFLRRDLVPALENGGALVLYVDLWQERDADPGEVITTAVAAALEKRDGAIRRLARRVATLEEVSVGSVSIALGAAEQGTAGVSLTDALEALSADADRVIVLIVDEAQHAITSKRGINALFGLKAARDALNLGEGRGLRIVATGSNRDKLAMLRNSKDQAFFLAPLVDFPSLGEDYVRWFIEQLPFADELDVADTFAGFVSAGHRPEILTAATDAVLYGGDAGAEPVAVRLARAVEREIAAADQHLLQPVLALTPLQSSVLREIAASGTRFAPFEQATMERYATTLARLSTRSSLVPSTTNVQGALVALKEQGLVWQAARGVYALEETRLAELMRAAGMLG